MCPRCPVPVAATLTLGVSSTGGDGGRAVGSGFQGGAGGEASTTTALKALINTAQVSITQRGGNGGAGQQGARGGNGAQSVLNNRFNNLNFRYGTVSQAAYGGNGGASDSAQAGHGAAAASTLTLATDAAQLGVYNRGQPNVQVSAAGGNGGNTATGVAGNGADASGTLTLSGNSGALV
ncbi:hypothetical protein GTP58_30845, partial [Duganella sp. CY15W]|nr:hypothetical protein [Duganella sp. CY15W]